MINEVYRDDDLLAVAKPAGLLCVPGLSSPDNLFDLVKSRHPNARVIHRLDMATSGLVLFALHYEAQKAMGRVFEERAIHKCYRAQVAGQMAVAAGEVSLPLLCDWPNRPKQKVCWHNGKPAHTRFTLESYDAMADRSCVRLFPVTGRTHQLRVHMQSLGHPILGDALYLSTASEQQVGRLMLHAESLCFTQPLSGKPLTLVSPCPF